MKREDILRKYGAKDSDIETILKYTKVSFKHNSGTIKDELFAKVWSEYKSSFDYLRDKIVEFNFPIERGISESREYKRATEEGIFTKSGKGLDLKDIIISSVQTPGGKMPTMILKDRSDFEKVIQCFSYSNEPGHVPKSMGASTYSGYNNWDRVNIYMKNWKELNPEATDLDWARELDSMSKKKWLYQDSFIVLSNGPYSAVPHSRVGLSEERWKELSLEIRKYHETNHYYTKRVLGSMKNNAIDELFCDYVGIVKATGDFNREWALLFLGLEEFPKYRDGGRLQNYINIESKDAVKVINHLVYDAIGKISKIHKRGMDPYKLVYALSYFSLEELANNLDIVSKRVKEVMR